MAGRLTPLGVFLKWVVVPVSLGAAGYFLVGPRVDGKMAKEITDKMNEVTGNVPTTDESGEPPEGAEPDEQPTSRFTPPEVDVTVTALNTRPTNTRRQRRRRAAPVSQPAAPAEPVVAPPPSSGGEPAPSNPE